MVKALEYKSSQAESASAVSLSVSRVSGGTAIDPVGAENPSASSRREPVLADEPAEEVRPSQLRGIGMLDEPRQRPSGLERGLLFQGTVRAMAVVMADEFGQRTRSARSPLSVRLARRGERAPDHRGRRRAGDRPPQGRDRGRGGRPVTDDKATAPAPDPQSLGESPPKRVEQYRCVPTNVSCLTLQMNGSRLLALPRGAARQSRGHSHIRRSVIPARNAILFLSFADGGCIVRYGRRTVGPLRPCGGRSCTSRKVCRQHDYRGDAIHACAG